MENETKTLLKALEQASHLITSQGEALTAVMAAQEMNAQRAAQFDAQLNVATRVIETLVTTHPCRADLHDAWLLAASDVTARAAIHEAQQVNPYMLAWHQHLKAAVAHWNNWLEAAP